MSSRDQILNRLKAGLADITPIELSAELSEDPSAKPKASTKSIDRSKNIKSINSSEFVKQLELANAQVYITDKQNYQSVLSTIIEEQKIKTLMASQHKLTDIFENQSNFKCTVVDLFQEQSADLKSRLFDQMDASITTVIGGICETGSLILIPDQHEPRTASLVPPIHIALINKSQLFASFADFIPTQPKANMPTNIILVSGPSKTADIQQTVAYGAHGPKQLIVIFCEDG